MGFRNNNNITNTTHTIYVVLANLIDFFVFFEFLFVNTMSDLSPAVFSRDLSARIDILKVYNIIVDDHQLVCARVCGIIFGISTFLYVTIIL